jgi:hypothetical protein
VNIRTPADSDDFPLPRVCVHESGDHKLLGVVFALYLASVIGTSPLINLSLVVSDIDNDLSCLKCLLLVAMLGMMFIMFRKYKAYRSSLITAFLRDGIGYFVCLSGECFRMTFLLRVLIEMTISQHWRQQILS